MERLLEQAIAALKTLPEEDQERIAFEIIERVEDKTEWDRIIAEPNSQVWLEKASRKALRAYEKIANTLTMEFVIMELDNLLREDTYWTSFDELPEDIRKLAEKNYALWKQNAKNPGLRFKQIHKTLPVFSFRVGMKHRTVGTEASDGKVVWFWVGSFETFRAQIDHEASAPR